MKHFKLSRLLSFQVIQRKCSSSKSFNVLFCGFENFRASYEFTSELFEHHPIVKVKKAQVESFEQDVAEAHVVIPFMTKIDANFMNKAKNLKLIMQYGTGLEGVDIPEATRKKIYVAKIPSTICDNASSCAEHIIYLTLSLMRNPFEMKKSLQTGVIGYPLGKTISGSKFLIYGYGGISKQLGPKLMALGGTVYLVARRKHEVDPSHAHFIGSLEQFPEYAANADVVTLCCSQNSNNIGLVNKDFLSAMKSGAFLVNVARGGLLNYNDVLDALNTKRLGGLGIDVYHTEPFPVDLSSNPLLYHPAVVVTPHVAGVSEISYRGMAKILQDNIMLLLEKQTPKHIVN